MKCPCHISYMLASSKDKFAWVSFIKSIKINQNWEYSCILLRGIDNEFDNAFFYSAVTGQAVPPWNPPAVHFLWKYYCPKSKVQTKAVELKYLWMISSKLKSLNRNTICNLIRQIHVKSCEIEDAES